MNPLFETSTREFRDLPSFALSLGIRSFDIVQAEQVHGSLVAVVSADDRGRTVPGCDSLATSTPGLPLCIRTADCVPVFIFDPAGGAIGLAHAGWRGSAERILPGTIKAMEEAFDTNARDCIIDMAPSIGKCCYEVDEAVMKPVRESCGGWSKAANRKKNGKWSLDLAALNRIQALELGVRPGNIRTSGKCTGCSGSFHSFRRDGKAAGRHYTIAMLRESK